MTGGHVGGIYGAWILPFLSLFLFAIGSSTLLVAVVGVMVLLALIYRLYLLISCCFRQGTDGPNRYGPDPLQGSWGD